MTGTTTEHPLYDATVNSDPARYLWLMGLGPYPYPLTQEPETSAPGAAPDTSAPAGPRAGEGHPDAVPGAEDSGVPREAEPLEPLPAAATCGLVSHEGQPCGLEPGHAPATHGPAEGGVA